MEGVGKRRRIKILNFSNIFPKWLTLIFRAAKPLFSYRQPVWHGLGETPITSIADALALGQLDYRVEIARAIGIARTNRVLRPLQCGQ